jgi:uncharacterized protein (UPF0332 family)
MDESELINWEAVLVYLDGARDALRSAQYNLDGDFYGVAVNRAYYAFFYTATALLLTLDLTRSKHSGVLAAFREYFVKPYEMLLTMRCWEGRIKPRPIPLLKMLGVSLNTARPI